VISLGKRSTNLAKARVIKIERWRHREGIVRAVHACLIHNTLLNPPRIAVEVKTPAIPVAA